jgi:peptidoglycan hydrolase-like protein with peptidoglycan-binding domain
VRPQPRPTTDGFNPNRPGERQYTQAPAINDVASGAATLRQGQRGPAVEQLQNELVKHGYLTEQQRATGPGIYGPATRAAVTAFQQDHNLTPPPGQGGTVGRTTLEALRRPATTQPTQGGPAANGNDVPLYRQGDARWGNRALGTGSSISAAGCAMTATAMAISHTSGRPINPGELDRYLDSHNGYSGNAVNWSTAAQSRGLRAESPAWSMNRIDQDLAAGRPVVVGVNHTNGRSNGGANGTDHWVTITGRRSENGRTVYTANDPANGQRFEFTRDGNTLRATTASGAWRNYNTTEQLRTFRPQ